MEIISRPNRLMAVLGLISSFLVLANLIGMGFRYYYGVDSSYLIQLFNMDKENNFPTYFSSMLLLGCAAGLGAIAYMEKRRGSDRYFYWAGLCFVFLFLSIDESVQIHERLGAWVRKSLNTSGVFHFAWIIPYGILVLAIGAGYSRFVFGLPPKVKKAMISAGLLYIGGALGMEAIASFYFSQNFENSFVLVALTIIEETMELTGLLLFLYCLLHYIDTALGGITLRLSSGRESLSATAGNLMTGEAEVAPKRPLSR